MKKRYLSIFICLCIIFLCGNIIYAEIIQPDKTLEDTGDYTIVIEEKEPSEGEGMYRVWRISDKAKPLSRETVAKLLAKSVDELDGEYEYVSVLLDGESVSVTDLPKGQYYGRRLEKYKDPKTGSEFWGDVENKSSFAVYLPYEGHESVKVSPKIVDNPPPDVVLKKYRNDADPKNLLPGIEFELYRKTGHGKPEKLYFNELGTKGHYVPASEGEGTSTLVTNETGEITVQNLPEGEYFFREIKTKDDLVLLKEDRAFTVTAGEETVEITVINEPKNPEGGFRFKKVDEDKRPLAGAAFKLMRKVTVDDKEYFETVLRNGLEYIVHSGKDGWVDFTGLPYGTYYLVETRPPKGYEPLPDTVTVTVDEDSYTSDDVKYVVNKETPPDEPPGTPDEPDKPDNPPGTPDEPNKPPEPPESPNLPEPPEKLEEPEPPTPVPPESPIMPDKPTTTGGGTPSRSRGTSRVTIPKTGDIQIFLYMVGGMVLMISGFWVYRDEKEDIIEIREGA